MKQTQDKNGNCIPECKKKGQTKMYTKMKLNGANIIESYSNNCIYV